VNGWALLAVVVLLLVNAYFVAIEFSVVGSRRSRLEPLADAGDRRARRGLVAISDLSNRLAGAQLGITVASLLLGLVGERAVAVVFERLFETLGLPEGLVRPTSVVLALGIVVFLHMLVGEMVPKNLALANPERVLRALAGVDRLYLAVVRPIVRLLKAMGNGGVRLLGVEPRDELASAHTAEELAVVVAASRQEGTIEDFAAELLTGVLEFSGRTVADVMVPGSDICAIPLSITVAEAEVLVVDRGHSRLPVTGPGGLDDIVGFVHAKDLLALAVPAIDRPLPLRLVRRMLVVPVDGSLEDAMVAMRRSRVHFALVQRPDGTTAGLVTLDDLLEQLLGDIVEELHGDEQPPATEPGWT